MTSSLGASGSFLSKDVKPQHGLWFSAREQVEGWTQTDGSQLIITASRQVLPVDLNSQLYRYEVDLAEFAAV